MLINNISMPVWFIDLAYPVGKKSYNIKWQIERGINNKRWYNSDRHICYSYIYIHIFLYACISLQMAFPSLFQLKMETSLFELMKSKTCATSVNVSPDGKKIVVFGKDKQVISTVIRTSFCLYIFILHFCIYMVLEKGTIYRTGYRM